MNTKTIVRLDARLHGDNPSKLDELQFLGEVADSLPAGSYLASLISAPLIDWFRYQSKMDLDCDLFAAYEHAKDSLNVLQGQYNAVHSENEKEISKLLENYDRKLKDWESTVAVRTQALENMRTQYNQQLAQNEKLMAERDQTEGLADRRQKEIYRLKAEIYDLRRELDDLTKAAGAA